MTVVVFGHDMYLINFVTEFSMVLMSWCAKLFCRDVSEDLEDVKYSSEKKAEKLIKLKRISGRLDEQ